MQRELLDWWTRTFRCAPIKNYYCNETFSHPILKNSACHSLDTSPSTASDPNTLLLCAPHDRGSAQPADSPHDPGGPDSSHRFPQFPHFNGRTGRWRSGMLCLRSFLIPTYEIWCVSKEDSKSIFFYLAHFKQK